MEKLPERFCRDCKWVDIGENEKYPTQWICESPKVKVKRDLVSGNPLLNPCGVVRMGDECGPAGHLWEPAVN